MNRIKYLFPILIAALFILSSCDNSDNDDCTDMTFRSYVDLEDCGFLLAVDLTDEFRILEAINLGSFDIAPSDGLEVCATFIERKDFASTCQAGEIVELTSLSLR